MINEPSSVLMTPLWPPTCVGRGVGERETWREMGGTSIELFLGEDVVEDMVEEGRENERCCERCVLVLSAISARNDHRLNYT